MRRVLACAGVLGRFKGALHWGQCITEEIKVPSLGLVSLIKEFKNGLRGSSRMIFIRVGK